MKAKAIKKKRKCTYSLDSNLFCSCFMNQGIQHPESNITQRKADLYAQTGIKSWNKSNWVVVISTAEVVVRMLSGCCLYAFIHHDLNTNFHHMNVLQADMESGVSVIMQTYQKGIMTGPALRMWSISAAIGSFTGKDILAQNYKQRKCPKMTNIHTNESNRNKDIDFFQILDYFHFQTRIQTRFSKSP